MKKILSAAVAVTMLASAGAAHADHDRRYDQQHRYEKKIEKAERRADKAERKAYKAYVKAQRQYAAARYQRPAGYQARQWRYGERLPYAYRTNAYTVDYNRYNLQAPPYGYRYVRVGNDVALTQNNTGLITSIILGLFR
jgi:Ni/Co efflux regulator RcnB